MVYKISADEVKRRRKNILLGALFSIGIALLLGAQNAANEEKYNDFLFFSVVLFLVFSNFINGFRFYKWQDMTTKHRIEVEGDRITFCMGSEKSVLQNEQLATLKIKRKRDHVQAVIVGLNNGNKIRLEGYNNLNDLADLFLRLVPA